MTQELNIFRTERGPGIFISHDTNSVEHFSRTLQSLVYDFYRKNNLWIVTADVECPGEFEWNVFTDYDIDSKVIYNRSTGEQEQKTRVNGAQHYATLRGDFLGTETSFRPRVRDADYAVALTEINKQKAYLYINSHDQRRNLDERDAFLEFARRM